jgi:hypothetical protein
MAEDCLELLKNDAWRGEMALRLLDYTHRLLERKHGWSPSVMLPGGKDPQNIVFEVFERVAAGTKKFNDRCGCEVQLKGMVRSVIYNLFKSKDATLQSIALTEDEERNPEVEKALTVGGSESEFEGVQYTERFFQILEDHPKVKKNSDLGLVIMAYVEGAAGSKEVAQMTGIPVKRVYEYNRNLTSILLEVEAKMKKENV